MHTWTERTVLKRLLAASVLALAAGPLTACSGDDEPDAEPGPGSGSPSSTERASTGEFDPVALEDYTYTLERTCQCPDFGTVMVTVEGGEATGAEFQENVPGAEPGDPAPEDYWLSINDLLAEANDPEADDVAVAWPEEQEWPTTIYVDYDQKAEDDEFFYRVSDVQPAG